MLTASSMYNHYYGPWSARLQARNYGSTRGGWIAKYRNTHQFLQIDLGITSRVKRIATQGRYDANQWVKSYTVSYSNNGVRFFPVKHGKRVKVYVAEHLKRSRKPPISFLEGYLTDKKSRRLIASYHSKNHFAINY